MSDLYRAAIDELHTAVSGIDDAAVDVACREIAGARHVCVYAGGREGLQLRGFAMRLFHMGRSVSVVGDMTTPPLGPGDLFLVVCGPGEISTSVALVGLSVPHFWLGLLLIVLFSVRLQWLPAGGYVPFFEDPVDNLRHMLLPAIVLGTGLSAVVMRQMRSAMLDSLGADYVRTARAKGLSEFSVVGVHALRNSLITVVTIIGLQLGVLISGAIVTEQIFGIAGFGRLTIDAVNQRDYALLQGVVLVVAAGYVVVNLLVDVAYSLLNPRIRIVAAPA